MFLKVRAINHKTNFWFEESELIYCDRKWYQDQRAFEVGRELNMEDCKVMQYTGLNDKNGIEIFEGDIVIHTQESINYGDVYYHSYAEVFRNKTGAYRIKGKDIYETELYGSRKRLTVIGNIFEEKNLLNQPRFVTEK